MAESRVCLLYTSRAVQSELEDSLAEAILAGEIKRGQEVVAGVSKKEIKFEVKTTK